MAPEHVDDPRDPRLADYVGLTDTDLRRRMEVEGSRGMFIAEGVLVVRELLRSAYPLRSVLVTPARYEQLAPALERVQAPVYVASRAVLHDVTGFDIHRGAVASADRVPLPHPLELVSRATRIAVLEGLNDHENLGVLFRNAAAFGFEAVLMDPTCADPLYRRAVRVSMGNVLRVPFARLAEWPQGISELRHAGWDVVALTPTADGVTVEALDRYRSGGKVAVLVGAEGPGLTPGAIAASTVTARITMAPGVDSLNVAAAAAIAFHRVGPAPAPSG